MNIITHIIKKIKFKQLLCGTIFLVFFIIGIIITILLSQAEVHRKLIMVILIAIIPCTIGMLYFFNRFKNTNLLIKYHGNNELEFKNNFAKSNTKTKILYKSPNHTLLNHIYITNEYLIIINNTLEIIPIKQIQSIKFIQNKGIINSSKAFSPKEWQNTALMTIGRGWPDTIYCYYNVEISINSKIIHISLIKNIGERTIKTLKNILPIKLEVITIPNFNDILERKIGKRKFWKAVLPGLIYLLAILFLFWWISNV